MPVSIPHLSDQLNKKHDFKHFTNSTKTFFILTIIIRDHFLKVLIMLSTRKIIITLALTKQPTASNGQRLIWWIALFNHLKKMASAILFLFLLLWQLGPKVHKPSSKLMLNLLRYWSLLPWLVIGQSLAKVSVFGKSWHHIRFNWKWLLDKI